ncbi:MAG: tetratricopeptide repeat protein, partial [Actinobacteria bacterium]|nr:tetratricopeptide repeat protein [Actinomycetota bacterium]
PEHAEASIRQALEVFRSLGATRDEAWALWNLAWISFEQGRLPQAEERLEKSARAFTEARDWGGLGWAHGLLGFVKFFQGKRDEAEAIVNRVIDGIADSGDRWAHGMMLVLQSAVRLWEGRTADAIEPARDAVDQFQGLSDIRGQGLAYATLSRALVAAGRVREGMAVLDRADEELTSNTLMPVAAFARAAAADHVGDPTMALAALVDWNPGEAFAGDMNQSEGQVMIGMAQLHAGHAGLAVALAESAIEHASSEGSKANALALLTLASAADGRPSAAMEAGEKVFAISGRTYLDSTLALLGRACALVQAGDEAGARAAFDEAERVVDATGDRVHQATTRLARAYGLQALDAPDAGEALVAAEARLDHLGITAEGWRTAFGLAVGGRRRTSVSEA